MDEFDLIEHFFSPLANKGAPAFGLKDDVARWSPPKGHSIVFSKDIMVSGVHFFEDEDPKLVAQKLLRVNLSDLASSGAKPEGYLLGLTLDDTIDENWLRDFADGLRVDQETFGIKLFGGDTVKGKGGVFLSLTIIGSVYGDTGLRRGNAQVGDLIFVTGSIGDAAIGLRCLKEDQPIEDALISKLKLPEPRLDVGQRLLKIGAHSAIDISDGLMGDLDHILKSSHVGAVVQKSRIPLSEEVSKIVSKDKNYWNEILSGGDDYEILFTCGPDLKDNVNKIGKDLDVEITEIGTIIEGKGLQLLDDKGQVVEILKKGYTHFE